MPIYVFFCPAGHVTEALCKSDLSDAPETCKMAVLRKDSIEGCKPGHPCDEIVTCGGKLERGVTAPASTFPGADRWRGGL